MVDMSLIPVFCREHA